MALELITDDFLIRNGAKLSPEQSSEVNEFFQSIEARLRELDPSIEIRVSNAYKQTMGDFDYWRFKVKSPGLARRSEIYPRVYPYQEDPKPDEFAEIKLYAMTNGRYSVFQRFNFGRFGRVERRLEKNTGLNAQRFLNGQSYLSFI